MELRRLLLVAVGAAAALLAGLPAALSTSAPSITAASAAASEPIEILPGFTERIATTQTHRGATRHFTLHVPDGLLGPAPLVVMLHAHSQTSDRIRAITRIEQLADSEGFVVAFPEGAAGSWNAGGCCRPGSVEQVDDVAFLDEVIALTAARTRIDPLRLGLSGASNGGMLALRYACERPDVVAAVAVVSSVLVSPCDPGDEADVLDLHGAQDAAVPLRGGRNASLGVTFPAVDGSLQPYRDAGATALLQLVPAAGHTWMTIDEHGLDATRAAWDWLRDHPRL